MSGAICVCPPGQGVGIQAIGCLGAAQASEHHLCAPNRKPTTQSPSPALLDAELNHCFGTSPLHISDRYKAYFRWDHYSYKIHAGPTLPDETEACASVTSAFLQVRAFVVVCGGGSCKRWRSGVHPDPE